VGVLDGLLYAVGGHDGPLVRKSVEHFQPDTGAWTQIADMHLCRRNAGNEFCVNVSFQLFSVWAYKQFNDNNLLHCTVITCYHLLSLVITCYHCLADAYIFDS